ncbi:MAG: hypothetical protein H6Q19_81 [Bacteroidetes bacterium]|nr:hypothetical protein [Bacteroidota bacterium]
MRKYFTFLAGALLYTFIANAQTTIYDGETVTPDFWDLGGNPPNGVSCPSSASWTLNVTGKMDLLTEGLVNPFPTGLNTTEKVVRTVRSKDGEGWAGAALNIAPLNLDINLTNKFSVLVYKEIEGNITMKLEGAGSQEVTAYYNTPGQWQKMEFSFDASNFSGSPTTLLVFPHNQTGLTETILTYWDEVTMYDASNNPTVIYNGNDPVSGFFIDGYWSPNGSLNNLETDIFPNLSKSGINTSNHVIRLLRAKDGESWCGIGLGGLNINVKSTPVVSLMILKSVSGRVGVKFEGAGSQEVYANYTTPGQWARLTFTFNSSNFSENPNTLIIFPHFEDTKTVNLSDHLPMYIDNVLLRDNSTVSTDFFRSRTTGYWSDAGTWESSCDSVNWVAATAFPTSEASSVTIQKGYLVTVAENATTSILTLNAGAKLTLNKGKTLNITCINILSDEVNGTGTFVDNGTFTATTAKIHQYLTSGRNWYVSSPVNSATCNVFSSATSVVSYNEPSAGWPSESSFLTPMKGYVSTATKTDGAITFSGTLNTGLQSIALTRTSGQTKEGFNLVGNPYPSSVNWTSEIATSANALPTIWYRTKAADVYTFYTYNAAGEGIGSPAEGTGTVPPMQAFWVRANSGGGTLTFDNTMRSHSATANPLKSPTAIKTNQQILRLQVSNGTNSDETVVYFNANASNDYDSFDSPKMSNANAAIPEIYTIVGSEQLVINGLNSVTSNEEIALGFTTGQSNSFTIKASQFSNFDSNIKIFLRDNLLNTEQELTDGSVYGFTSGITSTNTRFSVLFKSSAVATKIKKANDSQTVIYINDNNQIVVNCNGDIRNDALVTVYNAVGQKLQTKHISEAITTISATFTPGVYLVTVKNGAQSSIKEVILN